jgi:hypothetical protein
METRTDDEWAPVVSLKLNELCRRFREETERFDKRMESDGRFALEIVRRAVVDREECCWSELVNVYNERVTAWCRRADLRGRYEPEELVAWTWVKFWRYYSAAKLGASSSLAAVLSYLKLCAYSAVVDRARSEHTSLPLDRPRAGVPGATTRFDGPIIDAGARTALWRVVMGCVKDERGRVLVELSFCRGLRSAEVHESRPDLFASVQQVYSESRNLMDRLRRSKELRAWLEREELELRTKLPRSRSGRKPPSLSPAGS